MTDPEDVRVVSIERDEITKHKIALTLSAKIGLRTYSETIRLTIPEATAVRDALNAYLG